VTRNKSRDIAVDACSKAGQHGSSILPVSTNTLAVPLNMTNIMGEYNHTLHSPAKAESISGELQNKNPRWETSEGFLFTCRNATANCRDRLLQIREM